MRKSMNLQVEKDMLSVVIPSYNEELNIVNTAATVARILEENGLIAKSGRKRRHYANKATEQQCIEENLIQNKTSVTEINYLWCADITELKYASKEKLFYIVWFIVYFWIFII